MGLGRDRTHDPAGSAVGLAADWATQPSPVSFTRDRDMAYHSCGDTVTYIIVDKN